MGWVYRRSRRLGRRRRINHGAGDASVSYAGPTGPRRRGQLGCLSYRRRGHEANRWAQRLAIVVIVAGMLYLAWWALLESIEPAYLADAAPQAPTQTTPAPEHPRRSIRPAAAG